jgi:hypothetical protein
MSSRLPLVASPRSKHPDIPEGSSAKIIVLEDYRQHSTPAVPLSTTSDHQPDSELLCFPLTVDADLSAEAQDILRRTCGESVGEMTLEPLASKHQTKIWVYLHATAFSIALHAIIFGLPGAELGLVKHLSARLQIGG